MPDYILAASLDEASRYRRDFPGCRTLSVGSLGIDGLWVHNCYVTPAAAEHPKGPRAIDIMQRNIRKTTGGGETIYLEA